MKKYLKEHAWAIVGHAFIWVVPLITLLILTYNKVESIKYLNIVGVVGCVIFMIVYYKKLKKIIRDKFLEKRIKNEPVWLYRIFQWVNFMLAFAIFFLLYDFIGEYINEIKNFLLIFMIEGTFGYVCLVIDGIGANKVVDEIEQ